VTDPYDRPLAPPSRQGNYKIKNRLTYLSVYQHRGAGRSSSSPSAEDAPTELHAMVEYYAQKVGVREPLEYRRVLRAEGRAPFESHGRVLRAEGGSAVGVLQERYRRAIAVPYECYWSAIGVQ
jgi:hypothetical protein